MEETRSPNRSVLITGGSSGLGQNIISQLQTRYGLEVTCISRTPPDHKTNVKWIPCDLSCSEELDSTLVDLDSSGKIFDTLILNAACVEPNAFGQYSRHSVERVFNLNILANCVITNWFVGHRQIFNSPSSSRIIAVLGGGVGWKTCDVGRTLYFSSKGWLACFVEGLAREVAAQKIFCFGVSPGGFNSSLRDRIKEYLASDIGHKLPVLTTDSSTSVMRNASNLIERMMSGDLDHLTGRVLSPQWDAFSTAGTNEIDADFGKLRRIDGRNFTSS